MSWGINYTNCLMFVMAFLLNASFAYAQSNTTKTEANTPNKVKKETNKSVAQGLSVSESMMLAQSNWGFSLSAYSGRGLDEYADTLSATTSLDASYRLSEHASAGASVGYENLVYKHGGQLFNNTDPDPQRFGMTDTSLYVAFPNVWADKYNRLVINTGLVLPTSRASSRSSMIAGLSVGTALRYRPTRRLIITPSLSTYYRQFSAQTADQFGFMSNSPTGLNYSLSGSYVFTSWLIGALSYGQTARYDFNRDWRIIQSFSAQLFVSVDPFNFFAGYAWRDRIITNEPLFDDDRSSIFTGVGYVF